jgi:hypothetical protein
MTNRTEEIRARVREFVATTEHRSRMHSDPQYVLVVETVIGTLCVVDDNLRKLEWSRPERDRLIDMVLDRWREDAERDRTMRLLAVHSPLTPRDIIS